MDYSPDAKAEKKVKFLHVHIREYDRVAGDHPDANGVPISIGWRYIENPTSLLEDYERHRPPRRDDLVLSGLVRKNILTKVFQVNESDIQRAVQESKRIKKLREYSNKKQGKVVEMFESAFLYTTRKLRKVL